MSSSAEITPAVKPQTSMPRTWNAGPIQPLGWRTRSRLAGSTSSATGSRATWATSAGSRGCTGCGRCHQASTGVTTKSLTGIHSWGSCGEHGHAAGVEPDLLVRLAQRGRRRVGVARVGRAAGERRLAGVVAHGGGALQHQHVGLAGLVLAEQHQHGAGPAAALPACAAG